MNPVALLRKVSHNEMTYDVLVFWCPGCERYRDGDPEPAGGLHMLPISGDPSRRPTWTFDGNLKRPTLSPSILTKFTLAEIPFVCHSFLRNGVFEFLGDCTHKYANQKVPIPPLPDWVVKE